MEDSIMRKLFAIAALVCAGAFFFSCNNEIETVEVPATTVRLTVDAVKGLDTKALAVSGNSIAATWAEGETVSVCKDGAVIGTLQPTTFGSASTKLVGEITASLSEGDALSLSIPRIDRDYTGQDGTLETIASSYDYATANVNVSSVTDGNVSVSTATFSNLQSIVKFSLKDASGSPVLASELKIGDVALSFANNDWTFGTLSVTPSAPASEFFVALCVESDATLVITAVVDGKELSCTRTGVTFEPGKFYQGSVTLKEGDTYTVAGAPASVFGEEWAAGSAANDMELQADGTYARSYTVEEAATIYFKVVKNHTWSTEDTVSDWPSENYKVVALASGTLHITFNPETTEVNAWMEYDGEVLDSYTVAGSSELLLGTVWDENNTANDMAPDNSGIYTKTYNVTATEAFWFKVVKNHDWANSWPSDNYYFNIKGTGTLTITFDPETETVNAWLDGETVDTYSITGSPAAIFGQDWEFISSLNNMTLQADGTYVKSFEVSSPATIAFKIVKNHSYEEGSWPSSNYTQSIGAGTLYIYFNPANGDITVVAPEPPAEWEHTYTLAGDSILFGSNWDVTDSSNDLVLQADGSYAKTYYNVEAGTTAGYKVAVDHSWSENYGANGVIDGENMTHTQSVTGSVTFTYNPDTHLVTVTEG